MCGFRGGQNGARNCVDFMVDKVFSSRSLVDEVLSVWNVTWRRWVSGLRLFEGFVLRVKQFKMSLFMHFVFLNYLTLKLEALRPFETPLTTQTTT